MRLSHFLFVASAVAFLYPFTASSQGQQFPAGCTDRTSIVEHLEKKYGEELMGAGLHGTSGVIELYVSEKGTWTMMVTRPDGMSCPIAAGEQWRQLDVVFGDLGEPA